MGRRMWIAGGLLAGGVLGAFSLGHRREAAEAHRLTAGLLDSTSGARPRRVDLSAIAALPPPVERYLRHALTDGAPRIRVARVEQSGNLRTDLTTATWLEYTAHHLAVPSGPGFVWNARIAMPLGTSVRVLDSYQAGVGSGRVSLLSAFAVGSQSDVPELNSGALHRYLAEAVWYPTALLPGGGVEWTPLDNHRATATLSDRGTTVSLEFRFNERDEVAGIYSEGRFGQFEGEYRRTPWEGHFRDYEVRDGMRIPMHGQVGWYDEDGQLQMVWRGDITNATYEFR